MIIIQRNSYAPVITQPNAFYFTNQTGVNVSTTVSSNTITIGGMSSGATNTIYTSAGSLIVNGTNVGGSGTISNGSTVYVSIESSGDYDTEISCTITVGTYSTNFNVTTMILVTQPTNFSFTDQTSIAVDATVSSNTITIGGMSSGATNTISTNYGNLFINGTNVGGSGTISNGSTVYVSVTASDTPNTEISCTITVGTYSTNFNVTTSSVVVSTYPFGTQIYQSGGGYPYSYTDSALAFGYDNFTVDFTITRTATSMGSNAGIVTTFGTSDASSDYGIKILTSVNELKFGIGNDGSGCNNLASYTTTLNVPVRVTLQRYSETLYLFINGSLYSSTTCTVIGISTDTVYIGAHYNNGSLPLPGGCCTLGPVTITH